MEYFCATSLYSSSIENTVKDDSFTINTASIKYWVPACEKSNFNFVNVFFIMLSYVLNLIFFC